MLRLQIASIFVAGCIVLSAQDAIHLASISGRVVDPSGVLSRVQRSRPGKQKRIWQEMLSLITKAAFAFHISKRDSGKSASHNLASLNRSAR